MHLLNRIGRWASKFLGGEGLIGITLYVKILPKVVVVIIVIMECGFKS